MPNDPSKTAPSGIAAETDVVTDYEFPRDFTIELDAGRKQIKVTMECPEESLSGDQALDRMVSSMKDAEIHISRVVQRLPNGAPEILRAVRSVREYTDGTLEEGRSKESVANQHDALIDLRPFRLTVISLITLALAKSLEETIRETVAGKLTLTEAEETMTSTKYVHALLAKMLKDAYAKAEANPSTPGTSNGGATDQAVEKLINGVLEACAKEK